MSIKHVDISSIHRHLILHERPRLSGSIITSLATSVPSSLNWSQLVSPVPASMTPSQFLKRRNLLIYKA